MALLLRQRRGVTFAQDAQDLLMQQTVRDGDSARRDEILVSLGGRGRPPASRTRRPPAAMPQGLMPITPSVPRKAISPPAPAKR